MPATEQDRWHAKLFLIRPFLRLSLAFMWIMAALTSLYSRKTGFAMLTAGGIPQSAQPLLFYAAVGLNALIALALVFNFKTKFFCVLQSLLIIFYTLFISFQLSEYWLHPYGPIVKNIPILVAIWILYVTETE